MLISLIILTICGVAIYYYYLQYKLIKAQKNAVDAALEEIKKLKDSFPDFLKSLNEEEFHATKTIDVSSDRVLLIDDDHKKFIIGPIFHKVYEYKDLLNYEVMEDGNAVLEGKALATLVGSTLGGITGALAGSATSRKVSSTCSSLEIKMHLNDLEFPSVCISFLCGEVAKSGLETFSYTSAKASCDVCAGYLAYIMHNAGNPEITEKSIESVSERLKELKSLKEQNLISSEDYESKKKELLNKI